MFQHLLVVFLSMLPIFELRGTLLLWSAKSFTSFPFPSAWIEVYVLAVVGNIIPIPFLLFFFPRVETWLRRWRMFDKFFDRLFARTRRRVSGLVEKWGGVALFLFVAVPLPVTGAWTGSLVAYLFRLDVWRSFLFICLGVLTAGLVMLSLIFLSWG